MYAHLSSVESTDDWKEVPVGFPIGKVGKSGNASDDAINPHLHIEVRVWPDKEGAMSDNHSLRDPGSDDESIPEFERFLIRCADVPESEKVRIENKFDLFSLMKCYGNEAE